MIQFLDVIFPDEELEQISVSINDTLIDDTLLNDTLLSDTLPIEDVVETVSNSPALSTVWAIVGVVFALMVCFALVWKYRRTQTRNREE